MIINILLEAKNKLLEYKEVILSEEIEWVIKKIKNDDIYNVNVNLFNDAEKNNSKLGSEFENTMKLLSEYSTDNFNRNKREDILKARKIGNKRLSLYSDSFKKFNLIASFDNLPNLSDKDVLITNNANSAISANVNDSNIFTTPIKSVENFKSSPLGIVSEEIQFNTPIEKGENLNQNYYIKLSNAGNEEDISNSVKNPIELNLSKTTTLFQIENNLFDDINFNIFDYINSNGKGLILQNISNYVFNKYNLFLIINQVCFDSFLNKIKVGYDFLLPYHNEFHAADVLHTSHIIASLSNLQAEMDLTILDLSGYFIAAIIHDYKHQGYNNNFLINKRSDLSGRYNDISVLENYHVSSAFKVISQKNSNIFCDIQNEEYRVVRKRIVECVLATDMAKHAKEVASLKIKMENYKVTCKNNDSYLVNLVRDSSEESKFDRQQEVLNFFIHCADISNPAKLTQICTIWTDLVMKEFFTQGDLELSLNLPISFLCDRNTTNIPKSQIGFINNIVSPCFNLLFRISPKLSFFIDNLRINVEYWRNELEKGN